MLNDKLLLVGIAALGTVATAGWVRPTPTSFAPQAFVAPTLAADYQQATIVVQARRHPPSRISNVSMASTDEPRTRARRARTVYDDRGVYDGRRLEKERSTGKSALIIGGSAAAGAAIGGLAGGGKGAAIGALGGGAAGLIYDRMTKNK